MENALIPAYPESAEVTLKMRPVLHPFFSFIKDGVSEFTFANIYLFRHSHNYRVSRVKRDNFLISGSGGGGTFFMLPKGPLEKELLKGLFSRFSSMKCVPESTAKGLKEMGCKITEDRDNFDYLYLRKEMSTLAGRKFHKRKNLVNAFVSEYSCEERPLLSEYLPDALEILEGWKGTKEEAADYDAAKEALENMDELSLCGAIYYIEGRPVAYTLGEELKNDTFTLHFEKGIGGYKGLLQFVGRAFASLLPARYIYINREQDLGLEGLRQAKMSLKPCGFIKKYRAEMR